MFAQPMTKECSSEFAEMLDLVDNLGYSNGSHRWSWGNRSLGDLLVKEVRDIIQDEKNSRDHFVIKCVRWVPLKFLNH